MIRAWVWSICDGDVITEDDDIYGDGVNIAARLEPLAELSGIRVSSIVNESIGSRIDACFKDAGDIRVKNINRPIRIRKWHPGAAPDIGKAKGEKPLPNVVTASIAVLPFINMSGDPEQEYFSNGISEDIITDLSKSSQFRPAECYPHAVHALASLRIRQRAEGSARRRGSRRQPFIIRPLDDSVPQKSNLYVSQIITGSAWSVIKAILYGIPITQPG
jgi:adenylate cyclase